VFVIILLRILYFFSRHQSEEERYALETLLNDTTCINKITYFKDTNHVSVCSFGPNEAICRKMLLQGIIGFLPGA